MRRIAASVWDFFVGEDWAMALLAVLAVALTAGVHALHVSAWWVLPVGVVVALAVGVRRARRPT